MTVIRIAYDATRRTDIWLAEILAVLTRGELDSSWSVSSVETWHGKMEQANAVECIDAHGTAAERLEQIERPKDRVRGKELLDIARGLTQIIWGRFEAYRVKDARKPWMSIDAVDSSFFDVCCDQDLGDRIRRRFPEAEVL